MLFRCLLIFFKNQLFQIAIRVLVMGLVTYALENKEVSKLRFMVTKPDFVACKKLRQRPACTSESEYLET